jgi:hypothetical protein
MSCLQNQTYFGDGEKFAGGFILPAHLFCRRSYFAGAVISQATLFSTLGHFSNRQAVGSEKTGCTWSVSFSPEGKKVIRLSFLFLLLGWAAFLKQALPPFVVY